MSITGTVTGTSRADLTEQARNAAATYYGTECVGVALSDEEHETETVSGYGGSIQSVTSSFTAHWEGMERHRWEQPVYGFAKCVTCGKQANR